MEKTKCLEYYLDSKIYSNEDLQKNIEETKKEFPKKNIKVNVELNQFGMYVITFNFEDKNTVFNKIRLFFRKRNKKTLLLQQENKSPAKEQTKTNNRLEKYYGQQYGGYRKTGIYKPY